MTAPVGEPGATAAGPGPRPRSGPGRRRRTGRWSPSTPRCSPTARSSRGTRSTPRRSPSTSGIPRPATFEPHAVRASTSSAPGHVLLPDGRLFVAGGHELGYVGLRDTKLFNPLTALVDRRPGHGPRPLVPDDHDAARRPRPDRVRRRHPVRARTTRSSCARRTRSPRSTTRRPTRCTAMPSAGRLMPLYPFMFVAPDGRVVDAGPGHDDAPARHRRPGSGRRSRASRRSPAAAPSCTGPGKILKTGTWTDTDFGEPPIHEPVRGARPRPDRAGLARASRR